MDAMDRLLPRAALVLETVDGPRAGMSPHVARLLEWWQAMRPGPGLLPPVRAIDVVEIARLDPAIVPHLWLLHVEREPMRFRYRLVGGALREAGAVAAIGEYVDERDDGSVRRGLEALIRSGRPGYRVGRPYLPHGKRIVSLEALVLPFGDDGRTGDRLLNCTVYHWQEGYGPRG
jgi:hypothetical protein